METTLGNKTPGFELGVLGAKVSHFWPFMEVYFIFNWIFSEKRDLDVNINDYVSFKCPYDDIIHIYKVQNQHQFDECLVDEGKKCQQFFVNNFRQQNFCQNFLVKFSCRNFCQQFFRQQFFCQKFFLSTICIILYLESIVVMDCTGIADASTEFEFKIVEFSPMVTAYLFEAGRDYYYIGKFAHFRFFAIFSQKNFRVWNVPKSYIGSIPRNFNTFILRENHKNYNWDEFLDFFEFTPDMIFVIFLKNDNLGLKMKVSKFL